MKTKLPEIIMRTILPEIMMKTKLLEIVMKCNDDKDNDSNNDNYNKLSFYIPDHHIIYDSLDIALKKRGEERTREWKRACRQSCTCLETHTHVHSETTPANNPRPPT